MLFCAKDDHSKYQRYDGLSPRLRKSNFAFPTRIQNPAVFQSTTSLTLVVGQRICLSLQRADRELVLHGKETGRLVMLPSGEFIEIHEELSEAKKYTLTQHEQPKAIELVTEDAQGVLNPKGIRAKLQARFSAANAENIAKPTPDEIKQLEGGHH